MQCARGGGPGSPQCCGSLKCTLNQTRSRESERRYFGGFGICKRGISSQTKRLFSIQMPVSIQFSNFASETFYHIVPCGPECICNNGNVTGRENVAENGYCYSYCSPFGYCGTGENYMNGRNCTGCKKLIISLNIETYAGHLFSTSEFYRLIKFHENDEFANHKIEKEMD